MALALNNALGEAEAHAWYWQLGASEAAVCAQRHLRPRSGASAPASRVEFVHQETDSLGARPISVPLRR